MQLNGLKGDISGVGGGEGGTSLLLSLPPPFPHTKYIWIRPEEKNEDKA